MPPRVRRQDACEGRVRARLGRNGGRARPGRGHNQGLAPAWPGRNQGLAPAWRRNRRAVARARVRNSDRTWPGRAQCPAARRRVRSQDRASVGQVRQLASTAGSRCCCARRSRTRCAASCAPAVRASRFLRRSPAGREQVCGHPDRPHLLRHCRASPEASRQHPSAGRLRHRDPVARSQARRCPAARACQICH